MTCLLGECANFIMANGRENAVAAVEIGPQMMGLALGSSSQYSMTASYASTLDPASALRRDPCPPQLVRGPHRKRLRRALLEALCWRHIFSVLASLELQNTSSLDRVSNEIWW